MVVPETENTRGSGLPCPHVTICHTCLLAAAQRALEVNAFDPACLAFIHCFALKTQLPAPSGIKIHHVSSNTWCREMQRLSCSRPSCPRSYQHSPVINVYLCMGGGSYFSVEKIYIYKSLLEICRAWERGKNTSKGQKVLKQFQGEGLLPVSHAKHLPASARCSDAGCSEAMAEPPSLLGGASINTLRHAGCTKGAGRSLPTLKPHGPVIYNDERDGCDSIIRK